MVQLLPVSAIVPTRHRPAPLREMFESLAQQSAQPVEAIVVDASDDRATEQLCAESFAGLETKVRYFKATERGAATQRNQAVGYASELEGILFLDDDITFEPDCLKRMWLAFQNDPKLGGANATITNCQYFPPGRFSSLLFQYLNGGREESYAGKCIGPVMNLLPEDRPELPEVVPVEWINTTCALYRRAALPDPPFPNHFTGYSLMEDVTLSLTVGKQWKLANARTARIYHDSQPGDHKNNAAVLAKMDLVNRYYVMTEILDRQTADDRVKLVAQQLFSVAASLTSSRGWMELPLVLWGKVGAISEIAASANTRQTQTS
ncbi:MAG: glycosyltransferase family A protein [Cyanobacteria bacterium J06639_1]